MDNEFFEIVAGLEASTPDALGDIPDTMTMVEIADSLDSFKAVISDLFIVGEATS